MREFKIFTLPFQSEIGFDDIAIQQWLNAGRLLVKQDHYLINNASGTWLTILIESELLPAKDPYMRINQVNTPKHNSKDANISKKRREKRAQYKRDTEQALAKLDERGRILFNTLCSWRTTRAAEEGMPTYEFGSNLLLCEIAQKRPTEATTLKALTHFRPRFYKIAGEEVLKIVHQFEVGEENIWLQQQSDKDQS